MRASHCSGRTRLVHNVRSVAEKHRNLPLGGQLKEDYVFQRANDGKVGQPVKFSELFGDKNTLLLYSFMYGPNWDNPCPSCTSLVDGSNEPRIRSPETRRSSPLPKPRPNESVRGPDNVDGRRSRWSPGPTAYLSSGLQVPGRL